MEHIINSRIDKIDFDRYLKYVDSVRSKLPAHVYAFASDPHHFDLSSHSSLHDAWLETCNVRERASGERNQVRRLEIEITLLGPFHDRRIYLSYKGVTRYSFDVPTRDGKLENKGHGDLHTHEIRLSPEGLIIHELMFERGATFLIECSDIQHSEELIKS